MADYTFTPPKAGLYTITVTTRDDSERLNGSTTWLYVSGPQPFNYTNGKDKSLQLARGGERQLVDKLDAPRIGV